MNNIEELLKTYHLLQRPCIIKGSSRHNPKPCKNNPRCTLGLNEKKWQQEFKADEEFTEVSLREPDVPVGIVNHGSLCYSNVLLQLYFLVKPFRQGIYDYNLATTVSENESKMAGLLQNVFAQIEFGNAKPVDPLEFVEGVQLSKTEQQDANELYGLILSRLPRVANHFGIRISTITKCLTCKQDASKQDEHSYFLPVFLKTRATTIEDGLAHAMKEEKMDGENQYACQNCQKKTDALISHKITMLPKFLVLQVMRFEFNKDIKRRRKLRYHLAIREEFQLCDEMFHIRAIVVHLGASCNQGHYIIYVKDLTKNQWTEFNDEKVSKVSLVTLRKKLVEGSNKKASTKCEAGMLVSNNAYILMYESKDTENLDIETHLPQHLFEKIEAENKKRKEDYENSENNMAVKKIQWDEKAVMMRKNLPKLSETEPHNADLISLEWIKEWAKDPSTCGCIKNEELLCAHNKLQPQKWNEVRCINSELADDFYAKYKGGPRLQVPNALCSECVSMLKTAEREKQQIEDDFIHIKELSKRNAVPSGASESFWVGKISLRTWKRLAKAAVENNLTDLLGVDTEQESDNDDADDSKMENFEHKNGSSAGQVKRSASDMEDGDDEGCSSQPVTKSPKTEGDSVNGEQETLKTSLEQTQTSKPDLKFNDDLLCEHNNLCEDVKKRKVVNHIIWGILKGYFPAAREFRENDSVCEICKDEAERTQREKEENNQGALQLKKELTFILSNATNLQRFRKLQCRENRPPVLYLVVNSFIKELNSYIKNPQLHSRPTVINNSELVCDHAALNVDVGLCSGEFSLNPDDKEDKYVLLTEPEWLKLRDMFKFTAEIRLDTDLLGGNDSTSINVCDSCVLKRYNDTRYSYLDQAITVRRVDTEPLVNMDVTAPNSPGHHNQNHTETTSKRRAPPPSTAPVRRRRKLKGDTEIKMSSHETIKEIKLKIQKSNGYTFGVSDLHLWVDGAPLSNDSATLRDLQITPETVITMKVDRPVETKTISEEDEEDVNGFEDVSQDRQEQGFRGTLLQDD